MKIFLKSLILFLLLTKICFAQWYQQNSGTTVNLYDIQLLDSNNGFAVGDSGTILKTTNGGNNWTIKSSGTTNGLYSIYFIDSNTGWIVGEYGTIFKTTDGGNNWTLQTNGRTLSLVSVYFVSSTTGFAVSAHIHFGRYEGGSIFKTSDGGNNWVWQSLPAYESWFSVYFIASATGWAVGGDITGGIILKTTDSGNNWTIQINRTTNFLKSVYFTSSSTGWVVGDGGTILKTTDGGDNWIFQSMPITDLSLFSVYFIDSGTGWTVGESGTILKTTDGGENWISQTSGLFPSLYKVSFTDVNNGWAVGDGGIILHTTNGGVVPVELTSFTAIANGKVVTLNWTTATELNNQGFEIQRKFGSNDFVTVGFVNGHGTTSEQQNYCYADKGLTNGKYYYRLKQIDYSGSFDYSNIVEVERRTFNPYLLEQNYPNPFNPKTTIGFGIQEKSNIKIIILNSIGEEVAVILNENKEPGFYQVEFNAANLPSGVYFYRLQAGSFVETKKMIVLK